MIVRLLFIASLALLAVMPGFACPSYYSGDQCRQTDDQDDGSTGDGSGGGGTGSCPYYMCGNATPAWTSSVDWCEATQTYVDCPIYFCNYVQCSGWNCYPTSGTCTHCSSRSGNNAHTSDCPRT